MHNLSSNPSVQFWRQVDSWLMEHLWGKSSRVGLPIRSTNAGTCLLGSWGLGSWYLCPWELQFVGSGRPAAGFMSTRLFMILHIMQTLSDVPLDCSFLAGAEPSGQRHLSRGWSHEGCDRPTIVAPSPMWTSDFADRGPTLQMHTLALDARGFWSNVSWCSWCHESKSFYWFGYIVVWI